MNDRRRNRRTRYPQSWFVLADAESDPTHTLICHAAGVSARDTAVSVSQIKNIFDSDTPVVWYYVSEAGQQYGAVVRHVAGEGPKRI